MQTHEITIGDRLTPLAVQLRQRDSDGVLSVVDLTGRTVTFKMVNDSATVVVAETSSNVTVVDAANGIVAYDFQTADTAAAGVHWAWFFVYDTPGGERDAFPASGHGLKIVIHSSY